VGSAGGNGDDKGGAKWKSRFICERAPEGPVRDIEIFWGRLGSWPTGRCGYVWMIDRPLDL
jgi:hypothetical protein